MLSLNCRMVSMSCAGLLLVIAAMAARAAEENVIKPIGSVAPRPAGNAPDSSAGHSVPPPRSATSSSAGQSTATAHSDDAEADLPFCDPGVDDFASPGILDEPVLSLIQPGQSSPEASYKQDDFLQSQRQRFSNIESQNIAALERAQAASAQSVTPAQAEGSATADLIGTLLDVYEISAAPPASAECHAGHDENSHPGGCHDGGSAR